MSMSNRISLKNENLKHPIQPIGFAKDDVLRFKRNLIVCHLLEQSKDGLNELWQMLGNGQFSMEDMIQFYQLIGYSTDGFAEIFHKKEEDGTPEEGYEYAVKMVETVDVIADAVIQMNKNTQGQY